MKLTMRVLTNAGPYQAEGSERHDLVLGLPPKAAGGDPNDEVFPGRSEGSLRLEGVHAHVAGELRVGDLVEVAIKKPGDEDGDA